MASLLLHHVLFTSHFLLLPLLAAASGATSSFVFPPEARPTSSGYLPVTANSSLFFAFYEAQKPLTPLPSTPLLLWLQGGPGCSSLVGNFFELGPFLFSPSSLSLVPNPFTWNRHFGLLFIDSPVGTGYSIAADFAAIPQNQSAIAAHLSAALELFVSSNATLFASRPLYITGESYAGKYIPALGYHLLKHGSLNLQGVAIGDGLTHPVAQVTTHAASAYFTGLINARQKAQLEVLQDETVDLIHGERWKEATKVRTHVLNWLQNATGLATLFDMTKSHTYPTGILDPFLNSGEVKRVLGARAEANWVECSHEVGTALHEDVMKSVKPLVEHLVREKRVLLYQGINDLRDGVVSTEAWVRQMDWEGLAGFLAAERLVWKMDEVLAGYVQKFNTLSNVIVAGAGHLAPADRGAATQEMIENWVLERGFFAATGGVRRSDA